MLGLKIEIKVNGISPATLTKIAWPKCSCDKARISQIL